MTTPPASAARSSRQAELLFGEGRGDPVEVAVGLGGGDDERRPHVRGDAAQGQLGDLSAGPSERQGVGQLGPPRPLVVVEEVGALDEDHRDPAGGSDQPPPDVGARHAGVDEELVGHVVRQSAVTSISGPVSVPTSLSVRRGWR